MVPRWHRIGIKNNCHCRFLIFTLALSFYMPAKAQVGASLGYFSINSETSTGSTNLANLGHLRLIYDIPVFNRLALKPGYSLYVLGLGGTDIGYGFDLEFSYFPLSFNRPMKLGRSNLNFITAEKIRPFIGFSFHQRQYQSIQSNYAGMGISFGSHYQYSEDYRLLGGLSLISLKGPLDSSILEIQLYLGISLED